jgi:hypothetical protein
MAGIVSVLTAEEQYELVRLMKKLGKHAMTTHAKPTAGRNAPRLGRSAAARPTAAA